MIDKRWLNIRVVGDIVSFNNEKIAIELAPDEQILKSILGKRIIPISKKRSADDIIAAFNAGDFEV